MLPPPAIITRLTGWSMRRSSRITSRMCPEAARQNTSSPGSITVSPSGTIERSPRKIATMRVSMCGMWRRSSFSGWPTSGPPAERAHRDQAHLAAGEVEHLQRLGKLDQLHDVVGEHLLGADGEVDVEAVLADHRSFAR